MQIEKEDFDAGIYGDALSRVMSGLPDDKPVTEREIQQRTGLKTNQLNTALPALEKLGKITKDFLAGSWRYLKIAPPQPEQWYTIGGAASYLRVSTRKIYQLLHDGHLVSYRVGEGGHRRFRREDLDGVMRKDEAVELYGMSAAADPVLAELWDNEKDAEYDRL